MTSYVLRSSGQAGGAECKLASGAVAAAAAGSRRVGRCRRHQYLAHCTKWGLIPVFHVCCSHLAGPTAAAPTLGPPSTAAPPPAPSGAKTSRCAGCSPCPACKAHLRNDRCTRHNRLINLQAGNFTLALTPLPVTWFWCAAPPPAGRAGRRELHLAVPPAQGGDLRALRAPGR